jgi:hypothetical protein
MLQPTQCPAAGSAPPQWLPPQPRRAARAALRAAAGAGAPPALPVRGALRVLRRGRRVAAASGEDNGRAPAHPPCSDPRRSPLPSPPPARARTPRHRTRQPSGTLPARPADACARVAAAVPLRCAPPLRRSAPGSVSDPDYAGIESVSLPENFCIIESRETVQARRLRRGARRARGGAARAAARRSRPRG